MAHASDSHHDCHHHCGCCASMDRRDFMTTVGLSALAAQSGLFGLGSALAADAPAADAKPRVRAVFLHPKTDRYWMGWPGACYDIKGRDAEFTKIMTDAAEKLGVQARSGRGADRRRAARSRSCWPSASSLRRTA